MTRPTEDDGIDTARAAVEARMRAMLEPPATADIDLGPLYGWLRYQLGWATADGAPSDDRTAKGTRSRVCLQACAAVGGDPRAAVDAAAAIELIHEFSLIHDDIEDGDATRRGRPALWTIVGVPQAINAGDVLFALARQALSHGRAAPEALRGAMVRRFDATCVRLAEGQYLDMAFEGAGRVDAAAYEGMVRRKTGALLGAAAALGAVAAGAPARTAERLERWGALVGVAFQMRDDILGLWGDPSATGKSAGNDLVRRKRSLPIVLALADPALGARVRAVHDAAEPSASDVRACLDALEAAGIRARCEALAGARSEAARRLLEGDGMVAAQTAALAALAVGAVDRDR